MHKSMPTDQQTYLIRDENETLIKFDVPRQAGDMLKVLHRTLNRLAGFIQLTEEEQKQAGVYRGLHRYD
jgi:hypothetical protein